MSHPKNASKSKFKPGHPELTISTSLHEYRDANFDPNNSRRTDLPTTLLVVFDGETQRRFSSVRFVLYCDTSKKKKRNQSMLGIRKETVTHNFRGHIHHAPPNDPALPQLTLAFNVLHPRPMRTVWYNLAPPRISYARARLFSGDSKLSSGCVLLESEHPITPDTLSLSVVLRHSVLLRETLPQSSKMGGYYYHRFGIDTNYAIARVVRVVPTDSGPPGRTWSIWRLPMELLLKIFEVTDSEDWDWQRDLLSFAQVCRRWSCSMKVLFARLQSSKQSLDVCALAQAFIQTPALALGMRQLQLDQHDGLRDCEHHHGDRRVRSKFPSQLDPILRATKNLQRLHLSPKYSSNADAFFSALPDLPNLHTLSITQTGCKYPLFVYNTGFTVSTIQLAGCMARWSALTSLTIEHLRPGTIGTTDLFFQQPPACALTQLCIRHSHVSDRDLFYLTASSAHTLTQVTLECVWGITEDGLFVFIDEMCRNVTSMVIGLIVFSRRRKKGLGRRVLDNLVDATRCL